MLQISSVINQRMMKIVGIIGVGVGIMVVNISPVSAFSHDKLQKQLQELTQPPPKQTTLEKSAPKQPATKPTPPKIAQENYMIDGADPGIKLSVREKYAEGMKNFRSDNVVVFVHGATYPCIPDFDLSVAGYSWMNYMAERGFDAVCFDIRGYGGSTRPKALDEPAAKNKPVVRASVVIRDIGAVVDHIRKKRGVDKVSIIGWSWGAMSAPLYATIHPEKVHRLVLYAPHVRLQEASCFRARLGAGGPGPPGPV